MSNPRITLPRQTAETLIGLELYMRAELARALDDDVTFAAIVKPVTLERLASGEALLPRRHPQRRKLSADERALQRAVEVLTQIDDRGMSTCAVPDVRKALRALASDERVAGPFEALYAQGNGEEAIAEVAKLVVTRLFGDETPTG